MHMLKIYYLLFKAVLSMITHIPNINSNSLSCQNNWYTDSDILWLLYFFQMNVYFSSDASKDLKLRHHIWFFLLDNFSKEILTKWIHKQI